MRNLIPEEIKSRIKMPELLRFYGIEVDRHNRIPCPIHSGTDRNCGVKDGYIHCFVCGQSADQIDVVQKMFSLSFLDALKKIDADFGLGLYGERSLDDLIRAKYAREALEAKRKREKREKKKAEDEYWEAFDEWKRLDDNLRRYKPKEMCDELHPLFVEALQKIEYQKYVLVTLERGLNV